MSKKQIPNKPSKAVKPEGNQKLPDSKSFFDLKTSLGIMIAVLAFLLYAQSISFDYTLDDKCVITQNKVVKEGLSGIPKLLTTDYFYGYEQLRMPEYRPVSLILFAIEWEFFPNNPTIGHLINVLLYSLLCWLIFLLFCKLFEKQSSVDGAYSLIIPFACTLLYVVHPIHTEVVNNIKSCDELLCFLFGIFSILFANRFFEKNSKINLAIALFCYFISLMSKESGIVFLILIPLIFYVFTSIDFKRIARFAGILIFISIACFIIRFMVLKSVPPNEFFKNNNSLFMAPDFISQRASAFNVLWNYLLLLIFPYSMSHDYSYNQIPLSSIKDLFPILSIIIYLAMGIYATFNIQKKSVIAFAIFFYLITIAPVSNIFILIGSNMADRFLFMPSLGFCLAISLLLFKLTKTNTSPIISENKPIKVIEFIARNSSLYLIIFILAGVYSIQTMSRSMDWKDNLTLDEHDVEVAPNSARTHFNLATTLFYDLYPEEKNPQIKNQYLEQALKEYKKTLLIYPEWTDAYLKLSLIYSTKKEYDKAITLADTLLKYVPDFDKAYNNKAAALVGLGRYDEAILAIKRAIEINPKDAFLYKNLSICYLNIKQNAKAIESLNKAIELDPGDGELLTNLAAIYKDMGDSANYKVYLDKANSHR